MKNLIDIEAKEVILIKINKSWGANYNISDEAIVKMIHEYLHKSNIRVLDVLKPGYYGIWKAILPKEDGEKLIQWLNNINSTQLIS